MEGVDVIRNARARRYVIRVRRDGTVRVSMPRGGSRREALAFAERERAWIERERLRVAEEQARARGLAPPPDVERAWRDKAARELPQRVAELADRHGLTVARLSIRSQRWRWGSCSRAGHIRLNWRLVLMPPWVRDYVILHELMHLRRLDHSASFWKLVAAACPEYQLARARLREYARSPEALHYNQACAS